MLGYRRRPSLYRDVVLGVRTDLLVEHGPPMDIRSARGPEFVANAVRAWLARIGVRTLYIEKASS